MKKERVTALDYVRTVAMLAVMGIHVSSTFVYADSGILLPGGFTLAFFLNQVTRFAVPLFLLLSGLSLGLSDRKEGCLAFWKRRLVKLLVPYVIWALIYWFLNNGGAPLDGNFWRVMALGTVEAHLYFVFILFQLYLLYPLLRYALERWPEATLITAGLVSLVFHNGIWYAGKGLGPVQFFIGLPFWELFPTWVGYFVLGMYLARRGVQGLCAWAGRYVWYLLGATAVFGYWYVWESHLLNYVDSGKLSLFAYTPLVLLTVLGCAERLKNVSWLNRAMTFCAGISMTAYYSHILVLRLLRRVPLLNEGARGMVLMLAAEIVLTLSLSWVIHLGLGLLGKLGERLRGLISKG